MQPTYLPWSGYFGLMLSVDLFIILDSVQFTRRSWQQRNKIKTANGPLWLTVPVLSKGLRDQLIHEVEIDQNSNFGYTHTKSLEINYKKAKYYNEFSPLVIPNISKHQSYLSDLTIDLIMAIKQILGINTPIMRSSQLNGIGSKGTLLASLCSQVGANEYVSPPGSQEYLNESDAFEKMGIPVRYFTYTHPEYPQLFGEFLPYMSCIDLVFNCGKESLSVIKNGCGELQ